jgi:hypothetical protein
MLDRCAGGRHAAGVEDVDLVLFCHIDDGEQVAGNPDVHRLNDVQHRCRGNRGVDGVAAFHKHAQPGLCRERLARCHHTVLRHDLGSALELPALRPVTPYRAAGGGLRLGVADRKRRKRLRGDKGREQGSE